MLNMKKNVLIGFVAILGSVLCFGLTSCVEKKKDYNETTLELINLVENNDDLKKLLKKSTKMFILKSLLQKKA